MAVNGCLRFCDGLVGYMRNTLVSAPQAPCRMGGRRNVRALPPSYLQVGQYIVCKHPESTYFRSNPGCQATRIPSLSQRKRRDRLPEWPPSAANLQDKHAPGPATGIYFRILFLRRTNGPKVPRYPLFRYPEKLPNARSCLHEIHYRQVHTFLPAQLSESPFWRLPHSSISVHRYLPADMDNDTERLTVRTGAAHIVEDEGVQNLREHPSHAHNPSPEPTSPGPSMSRLIQNMQRLDGVYDGDDDSGDEWEIKGPCHQYPPRSRPKSEPRSRKRMYIAARRLCFKASC